MIEFILEYIPSEVHLAVDMDPPLARVEGHSITEMNVVFTLFLCVNFIAIECVEARGDQQWKM